MAKTAQERAPASATTETPPQKEAAGEDRVARLEAQIEELRLLINEGLGGEKSLSATVPMEVCSPEGEVASGIGEITQPLDDSGAPANFSFRRKSGSAKAAQWFNKATGKTLKGLQGLPLVGPVLKDILAGYRMVSRQLRSNPRLIEQPADISTPFVQHVSSTPEREPNATEMVFGSRKPAEREGSRAPAQEEAGGDERFRIDYEKVEAMHHQKDAEEAISEVRIPVAFVDEEGNAAAFSIVAMHHSVANEHAASVDLEGAQGDAGLIEKLRETFAGPEGSIDSIADKLIERHGVNASDISPLREADRLFGAVSSHYVASHNSAKRHPRKTSDFSESFAEKLQARSRAAPDVPKMLRESGLNYRARLQEQVESLAEQGNEVGRMYAEASAANPALMRQMRRALKEERAENPLSPEAKRYIFGAQPKHQAEAAARFSRRLSKMLSRRKVDPKAVTLEMKRYGEAINYLRGGILRTTSRTRAARAMSKVGKAVGIGHAR